MRYFIIIDFFPAAEFTKNNKNHKSYPKVTLMVGRHPYHARRRRGSLYILLYKNWDLFR